MLRLARVVLVFGLCSLTYQSVVDAASNPSPVPPPASHSSSPTEPPPPPITQTLTGTATLSPVALARADIETLIPISCWNGPAAACSLDGPALPGVLLVLDRLVNIPLSTGANIQFDVALARDGHLRAAAFLTNPNGEPTLADRHEASAHPLRYSIQTLKRTDTP